MTRCWICGQRSARRRGVASQEIHAGVGWGIRDREMATTALPPTLTLGHGSLAAGHKVPARQDCLCSQEAHEVKPTTNRRRYDCNKKRKRRRSNIIIIDCLKIDFDVSVCLAWLYLFLTASRVVLPQDPSTAVLTPTAVARPRCP